MALLSNLVMPFLTLNDDVSQDVLEIPQRELRFAVVLRLLSQGSAFQQLPLDSGHVAVDVRAHLVFYLVP